ncbi:MAG: hypothetical protein GY909_02630 [Oligoflexia bacterium]|nr:hypothetical protein [Oligoflexia bacterium]
MKLLVVYLFLFLGLSAYAGNLGHRASGGAKEYYKNLPENSLISLSRSLKEIQLRDDYLYLEFDIRETFDGELVVFHDQRLGRMLPYEDNQKIYDRFYQDLKFLRRIPFERRVTRDFRISDFKLSELRLFKLKGSLERVPSLEEFLKVMKTLNLRKPVALDIKMIKTVEAKEQLFMLAKEYLDKVANQRDIIFEDGYDMPFKVGMIMNRSSFNTIFAPHPIVKEYWCKKASDYGFKGLFKTYSHYDLCSF